ncbi:hypothetical protein T02_3396 [Trichinella nativa]|uniref:Uncharacterized protein n=1 Tax=Trichinella nativa TaxID=6335 RepID=A0A0V1LBF7_9BILA|nr:hypothetical protein T02_3396 [Trichinella nativa]
MNQSSTGAAIEEEKYLLMYLTVVSLKNYGKATFDEAEHIRDTSLVYFNNEVQEEEDTNKITMDNSESNFWIDLGPSRWDFTAWAADQLDKMHRSTKH